MIARRFGEIRLALRHRDLQRHQQGLAAHAGAVERLFQALVGDSLMRRMHVDQHQPGLVLRQDVDAVNLPDCIA